MKPPEQSVQRFVEQARKAARDDSVNGATWPDVVRECHAWQEIVTSQSLGADELRRAIQDALKPSRESVFAFLRYFDYAKWNADRRALGMGSEQRDRYLPSHVYWELASVGMLFQTSQQPAYAGDRLDVREMARYVADAVDCVGQLYLALGSVGPITLELSVLGVNDVSVHESGTLCDPATLVWSNSHTAEEWVQCRDNLASKCMKDLVAQCSGRLQLEDQIEMGLASEFERLDARRTLAS